MLCIFKYRPRPTMFPMLIVVAISWSRVVCNLKRNRTERVKIGFGGCAWSRMYTGGGGRSRDGNCGCGLFENYDPCFPDQPVVDRYLSIWASQPAFRVKPAFIWAEDGHAANGSTDPDPRKQQKMGHPITTGSLMYAELHAAVNAAALGLRRVVSGLRRGDRVLVMCSPGLMLVKTIFACQRAGLVAIPLIPPDVDGSGHHQQQQRHHLLRAVSQCRPKAAIADRLCIEALLSDNTFSAPCALGMQWVTTEELEKAAETITTAGHGSNTITPGEYTGCGPEDVYLIQYTSGATGIPKPVLVTAGAAAHNVRVARKAYDLGPGSMIVSWLPQFHDCGLMFLLLTIVSGATCVLTSPAAFIRRPRMWLELVTAFGGTCTPVPSFALPLVRRRGGEGSVPLQLGSLRNLVLVNEPIYAKPVDEFLNAFRQAGLRPGCVSPSYGLAENCTFVTTSWQLQVNVDQDCLPPSYNKLLPSARLPAGPTMTVEEEREMLVLVVDQETGEAVQDGMEGEIWICSPSNASGYLDHPSLTRDIFQARLSGAGSVGRSFIRTGDMGVIKGQERYLYVLGRCADVIAVADFGRNKRRWLYPHYIETVAWEAAGAGTLRPGCIAAVGINIQDIGQTVVIVAELSRATPHKNPHDNIQKSGEDDTFHYYKSLCERIREAVRLEEGVVVGRVVLVPSGSVPRTTSGKLQRSAAKAKLLDGEFEILFETWFDGGHGGDKFEGSREGDRRSEMAPHQGMFARTARITGASLRSLL